jgi:uncharacterized membrane protein
MKASASILINQSVADTFKSFSDIPNRATYLPTIKKLKIESLQTEEKGVEWREERVEDGIKKKGLLTVTTFNRPKVLVITTRSEGLVFKTRYNFQYAGPSQTKVVVTIGGRPKGFLSRVMDKFLSSSSVYMGQQLQNDLVSYKVAIERIQKTTS